MTSELNVLLGTGTYEPSESTSTVVDNAGLTAEPATVVTFVFAADVTRGRKSSESRRSYTFREVFEGNRGICGVAIAVLFAVDSLGSMEYESTEKNPIPPERSCSK